MKAEVVTITTTATLIMTGVGGSVTAPIAGTIRNPSASTTTVYIGGPAITADATATGGWPMDASFPSIDLVLDPGDKCYGIVATGTVDVNVLRSKE